MFGFCSALADISFCTKDAQLSVGHSLNLLYSYESFINIKHLYNEHLLDDPVGVHYSEVLL